MGLFAELVRHVESLPVTQGEGVGEPFRLLPWERRFLRGVVSCGGDAALSVPRGNGKTTLVATIADGAMRGPLRQPRGEVVIVASSFDQARISFEHCLAFLGGEATNKRRWRVWDTAQQARIECKHTGARIRCIGSDPRRAHGLAPVLVLADEPAQWPPATGERMLAALKTALGKIKGARMLALGTMPDDPAHWFSRMLDGGAAYAQSHAARPDDPPFQARTWHKANPSLRYMPELLAAIRREAAEARRDDALLPMFLALRLNLGTSDTVEAVLLDAETWERIEAVEPVERRGGYVLGADIGLTTAMSAAAAYWPQSGAADAFAVLPAEPSLARKGLADGVGSSYLRMLQRDELLIAGQFVSDLAELLTAALARWGRPSAIVCDRWREAELREKLAAISFPKVPLVLRGQGFKDGAEDVRTFRRVAVDGLVRPPVSLLLRHAVGGARVVMDAAGNSKLAKNSQGGRRARLRDDAAAALILAVAEGWRRRDQLRGESRPRYKVTVL